MYLVIYLTPKGDLIYRYITSYCNLKVGDIRQSSQWRVISVGKIDNKKVISLDSYYSIIHKHSNKFFKKSIKLRKLNNLKQILSSISAITNILLIILLILLFFFK